MGTGIPQLPVLAFNYVESEHLLGFVVVEIDAEAVTKALKDASPNALAETVHTNQPVHAKYRRIVDLIGSRIPISAEDMVRMLGTEWLER